MAAADWLMPAIAIGGFALTAGGLVFGAGKAISKISLDTSEKIADEREETTKQIAALSAQNAADRKTQDHNVGETVMALRRFIETVEKEMHAIEIWGRDNYALKDDVKESIGTLRDDIRALGSDIKTDMRNLASKIDAQH